MLERTLWLKRLKPDEVLAGNVPGDFLDKVSVAQSIAALDHQRTQRLPGGHGRASALRFEEGAVLGLDGLPVNQIREDDPLVLRIEFHPTGLVEPKFGS